MSEKSRSVAFLLSGFLGTFGVHRFYVGKGPSAITMLALTFSVIGFPISVLWSLVDLVVIISGKFEDSEGNLVTKW